MLRGNLKTLVLRALEAHSLSGYALMKHIEDIMGTKPSPGSIYPILDELTKNKLISRKQDGRKKIYSLTALGKKNLKEIAHSKEILMKKIRDSMNMWAAITGENIAPFLKTIEAFEKGKLLIEQIPPELTKFKLELTRIFHQNKFKNNKAKVIQILKKATGDLKKIK